MQRVGSERPQESFDQLSAWGHDSSTIYTALTVAHVMLFRFPSYTKVDLGPFLR